MKAVVYKGKHKVAVEEVSDPRIESPGDAIVRITTAAICGSDLHMYEERSNAEPGIVFGHENMGIVVEVGAGVVSVKPGDRIVLPFNIACGFCFNCIRGFTNACLTANPDAPTAGYGYAGMGPYRGGQAERLRVPFADFNCLKLPGFAGDEFEDDFVLLADIFPTGWHATELARVTAGDSVAVFGAGPVGLLSAYSALLKGAAEVYVVDQAPDRLRRAQSIGAVPIDFSESDPVQQIKDHRDANRNRKQALRPGEERMAGVNCAIDAVGYQARRDDNPQQEYSTQTICDIAEIVNPTGSVGLIGVYFDEDPGGADKHAKKGEYIFPLGKLWRKGVSIGQGQAPVKKYNVYLRDLIIAGRAKPSFIVSHRLPLSSAPEAYHNFDKRGIGEAAAWTKVLLKPEMAA
ncbi:MAG TPA: glutathione-independent formaldehyde dehydrogenase [Bryobacteraceae bacterium]|jgi:glutathione-independent formaldehyde dehydrogenase|nr:glutathione-independent formaldehyde dehydrogenase [Bryobacteraceae bacterium]